VPARLPDGKRRANAAASRSGSATATSAPDTLTDDGRPSRFDSDRERHVDATARRDGPAVTASAPGAQPDGRAGSRGTEAVTREEWEELTRDMRAVLDMCALNLEVEHKRRGAQLAKTQSDNIAKGCPMNPNSVEFAIDMAVRKAQG
jgi:hypothetical protein